MVVEAAEEGGVDGVEEGVLDDGKERKLVARRMRESGGLVVEQ